jgi:hypothetical protein
MHSSHMLRDDHDQKLTKRNQCPGHLGGVKSGSKVPVAKAVRKIAKAPTALVAMWSGRS